VTTTENTRFEIQTRYWRDWNINPGWGHWHPLKPKINYSYEEGNEDPLLEVMKDRIKKVIERNVVQGNRYYQKTEYKIVKVREIKIEEDVYEETI
jgi:hypothetical protein